MTDTDKIDPTPIIEAFGGISPMSFETRIPAATITSWTRRGNVPRWWSPAILKAAHRKKLNAETWGLK